MVNWGKAATGAFLCLAALAGTAHAKDATGVWLTESKKAHVQIYECGSKLCGKIVWLKEPNDENGDPKLDGENSDEAKRSAPLLGSSMISGMVKASSNLWNDGEIYNAEDGKTYSSKMQLEDDKTLKVSGCVFIFCKNQTWIRIQ